MTFKDLDLNPEILKAIDALGFETPTPIQQQAIPIVLADDTDLIALAQTGTGKTAAFGLPTIEKIDVDSKVTQAIVLCPTRELCLQISRDFAAYSKYIDKLNITPVYGGTSIENQQKKLRKGSQIVVGTPGRVIDLIKRGNLKLANINILVLDEADEMLNMGFKDDLDFILSETNEEKQTLLFSATMPKEVDRIARNYMTNPNKVEVGKRNSGATNVEHEYFVIKPRDRYNAIKRIADMNPEMYGIVFCRTRRETQEVASKLVNDGYNADSLHGDLSQAQRDYVMDRFRKKQYQLLIATDVASRGLDVDSLTHVINYNLPDDLEVYVHRSGRTGRANNKGVSLVLVSPNESRKVKALEKMVNKSFTKSLVPTGDAICERQLINLIDKIQKSEVNESKIEPFLPSIYEKFADLDKETLIKKFVSLEFNTILDYYKHSKDLNEAEGRGGNRGGDESDFARFHINIGKLHDVNTSRLLGLINECIPNTKIEVGRIDIYEKFSFFEVPPQFKSVVVDTFADDAEFDGYSVKVELAKPSTKGDGGGRSFRKGGGNSRKNRGGNSGGRRSDRGGFKGKRRGSDSGNGSSGGSGNGKKSYSGKGKSSSGRRNFRK